MILIGIDPYTSPSFSFKQRLIRQIWDITWAFLFRPTPRVMNGWRRALLRLFGARIGAHVRLHPSIKIWAPWNLHIDAYVGLGIGAVIYNMDMVRIESFAIISQGAYICTGSHDFNSRHFQLITAPVTIKKYAWICAQAFICPGVEIPEGSVIAARGVVSKSPDASWRIWAGVPVKQIGERSREQVER